MVGLALAIGCVSPQCRRLAWGGQLTASHVREVTHDLQTAPPGVGWRDVQSAASAMLVPRAYGCVGSTRGVATPTGCL